MNFLKSLALSLLNFLLFLSLSVFGFALTLNYTLLNPDFAVYEVDRLDMPSLAEEWLGEQIPPDEPYLAEVLSDTITDLEPWINDQVHAGIYTSYDYFLGRSQSLNLVISLEPVRETFKENLRQAILDSPPPELEGASPSQIELYLHQVYREIDEIVPPEVEISESSLTPEVLAQLEQARRSVGYFQLGYKLLIGFILLLILGIVLINRQVKGATRSIGIPFLTCGAVSYISTFIAKHLAKTQLPKLDIPAWLQTWLPQFVDDSLTPLVIFSIGLMIAGAALIIVSFVYKPRQPTL
jgi:hypothetical protein